MSRFLEDDEVIIIDDVDAFDDFRNNSAVVVRRGGQRRARASRAIDPSRVIRRRRFDGDIGVATSQPVLRRQQPVEAVEVAPRTGPSLGNLSTGEIIDTAAQALAALTPLPQPPTAQGNAQADVENMIRYQQALAQHAKRDEQLRTIGSIAKNLWS